MINRSSKKNIYLVVYNPADSDLELNLDALHTKNIDYLVSDTKQKTIDLLRDHEVGAVLATHDENNYYAVSFLRYIMRQYPNIQRILVSRILNKNMIEYAVNKAHINYFFSIPADDLDFVVLIKKALNRYVMVSRPLQKIDALIEYVQKFREEAHTDSLTQLLNRRSFDDIFNHAVQLYHTKKIPLTIVMLDLDKFKNLNDTYGHSAGDAVLREFAAILKKNSRLEDSIFRYGGEEFAIVAHGDDTTKIKLYTERVLAEIRNTVINFEGKNIEFTFSAGIESMRENLTKEELIMRADAALYHAKNHGRNQVVIFEPHMLASLK